MIIKEIFDGRPLEEKDLKEMLGHSPIEVMGSVIVGVLCVLFLYLYYPNKLTPATGSFMAGELNIQKT